MKILDIRGVLWRKAIRTTQSHPCAPGFADHCKRAWDSVTHPNQWWVAVLPTYILTRAFATLHSSPTSTRGGSLDTRCHGPNSLISFWMRCGRPLAFVTATTRSFVLWASCTIRMPVPSTPALDCVNCLSMKTLPGLLAPPVMPTITGPWSPPSGCSKARRSTIPGLDRIRTFISWKEVEHATAEWVNWYNTERLHGSIDYVPPIEYEPATITIIRKRIRPKPKRLNHRPPKPRPIHPD